MADVPRCPRHDEPLTLLEEGWLNGVRRVYYGHCRIGEHRRPGPRCIVHDGHECWCDTHGFDEHPNCPRCDPEGRWAALNRKYPRTAECRCVYRKPCEEVVQVDEQQHDEPTLFGGGDA